MKPPLCLAILAFVSGCAAKPLSEPTPQAEAALARALEGRVAGAPQSCIALFDMGSTRIIDRRTILFEGPGGVIWRNDIPQACAGLAPDRAIVTRTSTGMLCSGDIVQVIDRPSAVTLGSCGLGKFTPYRKQE